MANMQADSGIKRKYTSRDFSHTYGEGKQAALRLRVGLALMCEGFTAELCPACDGSGEPKNWHQSHCWLCKGAALMWGDKPATASVVNQVLVAAAHADHVVMPPAGNN